MFILLVVQYIFGMIANLYVQLPAHADKNLGLSHGGWIVWVHILLGTLLVFGTIALYIRAVKAKNKIWKISGGISSLSVILAWAYGDDFFVGQKNADSLAMSIFFIIALIALGWGIYKAKK